MCSRYGVGISPLREALSRLATHGLVTQESQRGFHVREASGEDLRDITDTRIQIETLALRQSIARGDDAWEGRVVSALYLLDKLDPKKIPQNAEAWEVRHRSFHFAILEACGSRESAPRRGGGPHPRHPHHPDLRCRGARARARFFRLRCAPPARPASTAPEVVTKP
jgi:hypothetical protein